ncbi:MAG: ferrous iron transport protein B [Epsilonproteobacteria bacterium]|nr:ferrous iron transport protein B [Campylobacterota bacterium]
MKVIKIALVGQPNVGKSHLINSISGADLHVGNFSGVTVDKKEIVFTKDEYELRIIDLPGLYSFHTYTPEEEVAKKYLLEEEYDVILNVIDSNQIERGLSFTFSIADMARPMVVAFNMYDEVSKNGGDIDADKFSKLTNINAVNTSAKENFGLEELFEAIIQTYQNKTLPNISYGDFVEEAISELIEYIKCEKFDKRFIAIRLLDEDETIYKMVHEKPFYVDLAPKLHEIKERLKIEYDEDNTQTIMNDERYALAKGIVRQIYKSAKKETLTEKIDNILIHPILGFPIFLFFMWIIFQATFSIGNIPSAYIDAGFNGFREWFSDILPQGVVNKAITEGIIPAVGAVVMFLPNILILFLGINLLEQTGYMARASYVMDGVLKLFGLQGKSFVPLVSGFGCSVPAYMAARTLKNPKDRLITMLIIGFMSCGARLPVYVLLVGAFFAPEVQGNVMFAIYIGGALMGLVVAKVLRMVVFKGEPEPFVMEMPKYRFPSIKGILLDLWIKTKMYLKKAGTFIASASFLIWILSSYGYDKNELANISDSKKQIYIMEHSYLAKIGKTIEPILAPIGMSWRESVALISGLAAKETVVSTMAVLYHSKNNLSSMLKEHLTFASAVAFIIMIMFYSPCLAAMGTFYSEVPQWAWRMFYTIYPNVFAWIMAFIVYNLLA